MGKIISACMVLVSKTEGKKQVGRPGRMWKNIIKTNLQYICWDGAEGWESRL
jgi:hypothetical protein